MTTALNRREFLGTAAGAATAALLSLPERTRTVEGQDKGQTAQPGVVIGEEQDVQHHRGEQRGFHRQSRTDGRRRHLMVRYQPLRGVFYRNPGGGITTTVEWSDCFGERCHGLDCTSGCI